MTAKHVPPEIVIRIARAVWKAGGTHEDADA